MIELRSLIAATDFSDDARNACRRAALLAQELGAARMELLHVLSEPALAQAESRFPEIAGRIAGSAREELGRLAAVLAKDYGVSATAAVEIGGVAATILTAMARADLLVVGAQGTNPLRDMILGTTAERLLSRAPRPVLVVKQPPTAPYRRVVAAVDFSPYSASVIDVAARIAPAAEIHICNAFEPQFEGLLWLAGVSDERINQCRIEARQQSLAGIRELIAANPLLEKRSVFPTVARGDPARVIIDQTSACNADLVVIGRQGRSAVEEFLLGSVTRHVLSDSKTDVLMVNA